MKNIIKRTLAITLAFALSFTFIPALTGGLEAHAAAKPAKVTKLKLVRSGQTVTLAWSKVKKNLNGYTIYRNGKAIKSVGKKVLTFKDKGLAPGTTYSYYVRAYRNVKQKQWYNKKTGKWQKSKPAKKYRGKSKKVTVRLYGKASPKLSCTTEGPNTSNWKISKGTLNYDETTDSISFTWTTNPIASEIRICRDGIRIATLNGNATLYVDKAPGWKDIGNNQESFNHEYTIEAYYKYNGGSTILTAGYKYAKTRPISTQTN